MRQYRLKKKQTALESERVLKNVESSQRQLGGKAADAKRRRARQTRNSKAKKKLEEAKKKAATLRTQRWRLRVRLCSSDRATQSSSSVDNAFRSSSTEKRAVKKAKSSLPTTPRRKNQVLRKLIQSPSVLKQNTEDVSLSGRRELQLGKEALDSLQKHISEVKPKGGAEVDKKKAYRVLVNVAADLVKARYGLKTKLKRKLNVKNVSSKDKFWKSKVRKTRKDKISEEVKKEVEEFYLRGDISKELPSKRDVCKVKDKEGNAKVLQKHLMTMTLQEAFKMYKEENPGRKIAFTSFRKFKPKQVQRVSETSRRSCLCKTCCNAALKIEALKTFANKQAAGSKINKDELPLFKKSKRDVADETVCPYNKETGNPRAKCLNRQCDQCSAQSFISQYKTILKDLLDETIQWYCWEYVTIQRNGKEKRVTSCVAKETSVNKFLQEYQIDLKTLPSHLFRAAW